MNGTTKIVAAIPCLLRGGTEMQTLHLARVLVENGKYNVTVVCYFESDPEVVAEFETVGAKVRLLNLSRSISLMKQVSRLRAEFRALRPDVVHVQYLAPGLLPILAARLAGCRKVLATVHQPWTPTNHGRKARWLLRFAARLCTRFTCVSEAAERSWFGTSHLYVPGSVGTLHLRHCTIHNAVDVDRIDRIIQRTDRVELRNQLGFGDEPVIGAVSRLTREKGIDILLAAIPLILRQIPNARFLIVGDGAERAALEAQARSLGLSQTSLSSLSSTLNSLPRRSPTQAGQLSTIVWAGRQPWERCIELMQAMDVVAVPSRFEGFGLSAVEGMACNKPVAVAAINGLLEVLGPEEAGVLFNPGSPADLAARILPLLRDAACRVAVGAKGRKRVAMQFSLSQFRTRTLGLYQEFLSN